MRPGYLIALAALLLSCSPDSPPGGSGEERPEILAIESPRPALDGSLLRVTGIGFDALLGETFLEVRADGVVVRLPREPVEDAEENRFFAVNRELVDALGEGEHGLVAVIGDAHVESEPFPFVVEIARSLPIRLDDVPSGDVHRNELWIVSGAGFLAEGEGEVEARFVGSFVPDGGGSVPIDVGLPLVPAERFSRTRGIVRLTSALGGIVPGTFDGTVTLEQRLRGGASSTSRTADVSLRFLPPELFAVEPTTVTLEQIVTVRGAGFLGGPDEPDEATLIRLTGTFQPLEGAPSSFGPAELVLEWVSGSQMRGVMRAIERDGELVSELFGARRGTFTGTATPVVLDDTTEVEGATVPFELILGPVRQVVHLRFLPGFYDSLTRFGLAAASGEIERRVEERIESIYEQWLVDVRLEEPADFSPNGYAVLEIGGPDPNGVGLFGYDNTPGKDVGNLRLYDAIGGTNAETQADGYPGYGGVFVESFLYFSSHPDLPGDEPTGGPEPDPLFDEIFDPVRSNPATLAEVRGESGRIGEVGRALHALASIIGETAAHELGHSLGLANPSGPRTAYHNDSDGEGCLMDSGGDRPLGERADEPSFAPTRLCHDAPAYLDAILGR